MQKAWEIRCICSLLGFRVLGLVVVLSLLLSLQVRWPLRRPGMPWRTPASASVLACFLRFSSMQNSTARCDEQIKDVLMDNKHVFLHFSCWISPSRAVVGLNLSKQKALCHPLLSGSCMGVDFVCYILLVWFLWFSSILQNSTASCVSQRSFHYVSLFAEGMSAPASALAAGSAASHTPRPNCVRRQTFRARSCAFSLLSEAGVAEAIGATSRMARTSSAEHQKMYPQHIWRRHSHIQTQGFWKRQRRGPRWWRCGRYRRRWKKSRCFRPGWRWRSRWLSTSAQPSMDSMARPGCRLPRQTVAMVPHPRDPAHSVHAVSQMNQWTFSFNNTAGPGSFKDFSRIFTICLGPLRRLRQVLGTG